MLLFYQRNGIMEYPNRVRRQILLRRVCAIEQTGEVIRRFSQFEQKNSQLGFRFDQGG